MAGKYVQCVFMGLFALAAAGLWFQSRVAAGALITLAFISIIYSLFKIGHAPWYRIASPISWALWGMFLLWEYREELEQEP